MKKLAFILLCVIALMAPGPASANLDDTRDTIAAKYGDYRLVVDIDYQLWTKADWEAKGKERTTASSFMYSFTRLDLGMQMEVQYESNKPGAYVTLQRFTPNMPIPIKDFKKYFPEAYALIASPQAEFFVTSAQLTRNFQENKSPLTLGVLVRLQPAPGKKSSYTLMAFNIQEEGRVIKEAKYINENTYIREFTIEPLARWAVNPSTTADWVPIKNYF